jgi:hypothetical protein
VKGNPISKAPPTTFPTVLSNRLCASPTVLVRLPPQSIVLFTTLFKDAAGEYFGCFRSFLPARRPRYTAFSINILVANPLVNVAQLVHGSHSGSHLGAAGANSRPHALTGPQQAQQATD